MARALVLLIAATLHSQTIAIRDVTVIDSQQGKALPHFTILTSAGRITAVGPNGTIRVPGGTKTLQGSGKFVIPGLWDMHVHVGEIEEDWFPLYLANGITGVREMAASPANLPKQLKYARDVAAGTRVGPELLSTLHSMDTPEIANPAQARAEVARRAALGLGYIKVYNGLSRESYFAIADECKRRGLQMVGHIPDRIRASEVGRAGQASVEHLDGILLACSTKEAEARYMLQLNHDQWKMLVDTFDPGKADALSDSLRDGGVWQTPTLLIHQVAVRAREGRLEEDPRLIYARSDYRKGWRREAPDLLYPRLDAVTVRRVFELQEEVVRRMHRRGVMLLAGTDTPAAYCIPGFALHDELALLVESGLTPAAALKTATWNPAQFLKLTNDYGAIEKGKVADLVVLDADPLQSIRNTTKIHAVMRKGRLIETAELKKMLEGVRQQVSKR